MPRSFPIRRLRTPTLYTFGEDELSNLDDRTALVLRMRSGMWDGRLYNLREVGERIGVKGERVRQIQNQGLVHIRGFREAQRHMGGEPRIRRSVPPRPPQLRSQAIEDNTPRQVTDGVGCGRRALGEAIKGLRIERGIGPRTLAVDAEITEPTLTKLEEGEAEPRWETLQRVARGLKVGLPVVLRKAEELEAEMGKRA